MSNQDSKGKLLPWAIAAIVALLGSNIFLYMKKGAAETKTEQVSLSLNDMQSTRDSLQRTYDAALVELEGMKGKNSELNALIDRQKEELTKQKSRIETLMKSSGSAKAAQAEIAKLKSQIEGYVAQIAELNTKNELLAKDNATLTTEKTTLQQDIQKARVEIENVSTQKAAVEAEKKKVEDEKTGLAKQVEAGSVISVGNFSELQGFQVRESGKERKKKWAENMERVKFSFDISENRIVKSGKETFYLRIIDPTGVAIAVQTAGAGVIKLNDGKEVQYTLVREIEYNGQGQKVDVTWDPGVALSKGNYTIEVYNKGYLAGKHSFTLKK